MKKRNLQIIFISVLVLLILGLVFWSFDLPLFSPIKKSPPSDTIPVELFPLTQCQDGIDNDCSGFVDYPDDWGCNSLQDNTESNGFIWGYGYGGARDPPRILEQTSDEINTLFIYKPHIANGSEREPFQTIETGLEQDKKFIFDSGNYFTFCLNYWHSPLYNWSDPLTQCFLPMTNTLIDDLANEENRNRGFLEHLFGIYIFDEPYIRNCFATDPIDGERFNRTSQEFVVEQIKIKFQERFNRPIKTIINYAIETEDIEGIEEECVRNNAFVNLDGSGGIPENLDIVMFDYYPFNSDNEGNSSLEYQEFIEGRIEIIEETAPGKPIFLWGASSVRVDADENILPGTRFPNNLEMSYYYNTVQAHPQVRGMLWFFFDAIGEDCSPDENCSSDLYIPIRDYLNYSNRTWVGIGPGHKESEYGEFFDAEMVNRIKQLGIRLQGKCTICGDGILEGDEECDDGNGINEDCCTNNCRWARCGDGICASASSVGLCVNELNCSSPMRCEAECGLCIIGSFAPGTKITTNNNLEKNIEEIKAGDLVLSFNEKTSSLTKSKVLQVFEHDADGYYIINGKIKVTAEHPIWANGEWKKVSELKIGDALMTKDKTYAPIYSISYAKEKIKVYNLKVENTQTYFAEGILVHNKPPDPCQSLCEQGTIPSYFGERCSRSVCESIKRCRFVDIEGGQCLPDSFPR